jgi:aromatic ring-opening dioxygenase LigB subunit
MNIYECIFGMIFCFTVMSIGLLRIIRRKKITKKGLTAEGLVSAVNTEMFRNRITFHTVICFKTLKGKDIEVSLDEGMPVPIHTIGNKIKLLYDRDNPEEIVLVSKVAVILEYFISILGAVGLSFFIIMFLKT